jgi:hypothetical protein
MRPFLKWVYTLVGASALCLSLGSVSLLCAHQPARAQAFEQTWDGLEELIKVAVTAEVSLTAPASLNLTRMEPGDAVLVVSPRRSLPVQALTTFLREGGRVAVLDDVGAGDRLLAAYQVSRTQITGAVSAPALRGDPALLVAYPASEHPLVVGVSLLLTNHASELHHPELRPVFTFGRSGHALMLAGAVGAGRLVAIGDGGLLSNQMLSAPAHRRFAQNLLRYLARPGGRVWLVGPRTTFEGSYGNPPLALARLDSWLKRLARPDFPPAVLWLLSLALCGIAAVVAAGALPRRSPYVRPDLFPASDVFAGFAGRIAAVESEGMSLRWPLLDYRRELEAELTRRLAMSGAFDRSEALRRAQRSGLSAAETRELDQLLAQLEAHAAETSGSESARRIPASALQNVVRKGEELLGKLGNDK